MICYIDIFYLVKNTFSTKFPFGSFFKISRTKNFQTENIFFCQILFFLTIFNLETIDPKKDLIKYLDYLDKNETAYLAYHQWRVDLSPRREIPIYELDDLGITVENYWRRFLERSHFCSTNLWIRYFSEMKLILNYRKLIFSGYFFIRFYSVY